MSRAREFQFPYRVESVTNLPEGFRRAAEDGLPSGEALRVILIIPPGAFFDIKGSGAWHSPQQALLFTQNGLLQISEADGRLRSVYLAGADLLYAHYSLILLYGRLELCGVSGQELETMVIEYNTVGHALIQPELERFIGLACPTGSSKTGAGDKTEILLQTLEQESFKFANGLRLYAMPPAKSLLGFVFQARITRPFLVIFRREVVPACLLSVTELTVILIEEKHAKGASYGWVITIIPRQRVTGNEIIPRENWNDVAFTLKHNNFGVSRTAMLSDENIHKWQALCQEASLCQI